jgi:lysine-N-methylase
VSTPLKVIQPRYVDGFRCTRSLCEDTCCEGNIVVIDKPTYEKYQHCPDPELKQLIAKTLVVNPASTHDATFALINGTHEGCPFLTEDRLCSFQQRLGEDYLSRACSTYPRAISQVDGVMERSLYLSCPEAVRLALLSPTAMDLDEMEHVWDSPFGDFPSLDSSDPAFTAKPYRYFQQVRGFIDALLRNRAYTLWERITIVGIFCDQLNTIAKTGDDSGVPELIVAYSGHVDDGTFHVALQNTDDRPDVQLRFLTSSIDHRLSSAATGARFIECFQEFMRGVEYSAESTVGDVTARYDEANTRYYRPFMVQHPYIMENYLLNHVFKNLFPFGPQKAVYLDDRTIYDEFLLMVIQYSLVRSLLIGIAGYHKENFSTAHVVKLVQSFAKSIEHDLPYLKRILASLAENEMTNLAVVALLLKS